MRCFTCKISFDSFFIDSINGLTTGRILSGKYWSIVNAPANDALVLYKKCENINKYILLNTSS